MSFFHTRPAGTAGTLCFLAGFCLFAACTAAKAWSPDPSQPAAAVFYPDEVQVTVEERLTPEALPSGGTGFLLAIPAGARADTFLISLDGAFAGGYYWLPEEERNAALAGRTNRPVPGSGPLPEHEPSPERRALLEAVTPLQDEMARRIGELAGVEARLALWEKSLERFGQSGSSRAPASSEVPSALPLVADEAAGLDASYKRQYPGLYQEREACRRALADVRLRLDEAQKALDAFDHKAGCELVAVPFSGQAKAVALRYSYVIPASCTFSYRLTAYPDKEELTIAQDATLFQASGFTWQETDLYLSTLRRDRTLRPLPIEPWKLRLESRNRALHAARKSMADKPPAPAQAARALQDDMMLAAAPEQENRQGAPQQPVQEERSTFRLWNLGKQRVENNFPVRLALAEAGHKATFLYTLRPVSNPKGFLTAELNLPQALELPPGMARFAVDDLALGSQMFSFNGNKGTIFFGSDPQVTALLRDMKQSSGEEGFFNKDETREWHWQITLKNTRAKAVAAWLEDPAPRAANEAIKISVESTPRPEELVNPPEDGGATIYRWKTVLKPGEPLVINHKVRATAPLDGEMELNPGR